MPARTYSGRTARQGGDHPGRTSGRASANWRRCRPGPAPQRPPDALHPILRLRDLLADNRRAGVDRRQPRHRDARPGDAARRSPRRCATGWRRGARQARSRPPRSCCNGAATRCSQRSGPAVYGGSAGGAIDFTRASRSPGSTLKPFLYAAALQRGLLNPAEMLDDRAGRGAGIGNADGAVPRPPAAAPGAGQLAQRAGGGCAAPARPRRRARRCSATSGCTAGTAAPKAWGCRWRSVPCRPAWTSSPPPTPRWPMTACGTTCAGIAGPRRRRRIACFSVTAARQVGPFLSDPMARLPGFARYGSTEYPFPVAVKTGTSQGYRDAWTVAWSSRFLVAVWVGRSDAGPMASLGGAVQRGGTDQDHPAAHAPDGSRRPCRPTCCRSPTPMPRRRSAPARRRPKTTGAEARCEEFLPAPAPAVTAPADPDPVRLSIVTPEAGSRVWRNPESPASAAMLALRASARPHVPQIVWYVDNQPFALSDPDVPVAWPMHAGEHHFQIGLPMRPDRSRPIRVVVE